MIRPACFGLLLLLANSMLSVGAAEVSWVADGVSRVVLLHAAAPAPCVDVAVSEMRHHLQRMTGSEIPTAAIPDEKSVPIDQLTRGRIPVFIGASRGTRAMGIDEDELESESFIVDIRRDRAAIVGKDGDSYGANYRFVTASAGTLYGTYAFLESLGVRWYYPDERGTLIPRLRNLSVPTGRSHSRPVFPYRHNGYGEFAWGRRIGAGGDRDIWSTRHTCSTHLQKHCRDAHPEWFFRNADGEPGHQADLAYPEVVNVIADMAARRFEDRPPGQRYFLVIPLDGRAHLEDDARSSWVTAAVRQVADKLLGSHPHGHIVYCAYNDYRVPPPDLQRLPANVVVLIAQSRAALLDEESREKAYDLVRAWQSRRPAGIAFCRYNGNRLRMMPALIPHVIAADLRRLKALSDEGPAPIVGEMNFVGVKAGSPFSWWEHLNEYVAAKLLWDPGRDVDDLLDEFCERFFGPAARPMRQYLDLCERAYLDPHQRHLFSLDTIDRLGTLMAQAEELSDDTAAEIRVAFFADGYQDLARVKTKLQGADAVPPDPDDAVVCHITFDQQPGEESVRDRLNGQTYEIRGGRWTSGVDGNAVSFADVYTGGVYLGGIDLSGSDYTIEAWIKPAAPRQGRAFVAGPDAWERHVLMIDFGLPTDQGHSGRLILKHRRWEGGENISLASAPFEFLPNKWVHVAGTFSQTNGMAVYIDGRLAGLDMNLTKPSDMKLFWIGASGQGATADPDDTFGHFPGSIDEVRIAKRELSAKEIYRRARKFPAK